MVCTMNAGQPAHDDSRWLSRGVIGIGGASLLSDLGHEVPTALLPSFLTSTLGEPAAALGLIEGIADGFSGAARFAGGALANDPARRERTAVGGYVSTAILSSLIGVTASAWQAGALRTAAWSARGLRVPSRNALLADIVPARVYGRAYGFERMMDNLGAIFGPLLALALVTVVGTRTAILISVIPGLLAALAIVYAIRSATRQRTLVRRPLQLNVRQVFKGKLGGLLFGVSAFEVGNVAATLLILRSTELLKPEHGIDDATRLSIVLYLVYNIVATASSLAGGRLVDRRGAMLVLTVGIGAFAMAYSGFAITSANLVFLALGFALAGVAIGFVETAENAAVALFAPDEIRGSAFGMMSAIQSFGNLAASGTAGVLWTAVSAEAAFFYLAAWMVAALAIFALVMARQGPWRIMGI
jgi:MFS family permease